MYYLFTILSAFGFCMQFVFMKVYQKSAGKTLLFSSIFSLASACVAACFFLCANGFKLQFSWFSIFVAITWAVGLIMCSVLGIRAVSLGNMAVYTMFMMLGGMFLPFLFGTIFLREGITLLKIIALVLLVLACAIPCIRKNGGKSSKLFYVLCMAVFISNGGISILGKIHQINSSAIPTIDFLIWANLFTIVLSGFLTFVLLLAERYKKGDKLRTTTHTKSAELLTDGNSDTKSLYEGIVADTVLHESVRAKLSVRTVAVCAVMIAAYALVSSTANMLQLIGAAHLPASVLYPIVTGGTVVLTTIAGALLFKEKVTTHVLIATILSFSATVLFMF